MGLPGNGKRHAWCVFAAFFLFYFSISPLTTRDMGYIPGDLRAADELIQNIRAWAKFHPATTRIDMPRNGIIETVFEIPFVLVGRAFGDPDVWPDRLVSIEFVLATALLVTIVFVWSLKITSSLDWSYMLSIAAGLTTMLWPYAYIGMETIQALFLMLAAYLALGPASKRTPLASLAFSVSCGIAVSVKSGGLFLIPAIGYLLLLFFKQDLGRDKPFNPWGYRLRTAALIAIVAAIYVFNARLRSLAPIWQGSMISSFRGFAVAPNVVLLNILSLFGSINKGLLVYCPVILLCLLSLKKAYHADKQVVTFVVLALSGLVLGAALMYFWADETWGPRYLDSLVAPMMICLALAKKGTALVLRRELTLIFLMIAGAAISSLGVLFSYHTLHVIAMRTTTTTYEQLQYDVQWNPIRFDLKLLQLWLKASKDSRTEDRFWPPPEHFDTLTPRKMDWIRPVDITDDAVPQAYLLRTWRRWEKKSDIVLWATCLLSLAIAAATTGWGLRALIRSRRAQVEA
jgi:hypothetical protein